jgi:Double zinc ribbon
MSAPTISCPSCGKPAGGRFCRHCGASAANDRCGRCGGTLGAGARFCPQCGASANVASGSGLGRNERVLWFLAGGLVVAVVGGLALSLSPGRVAPPVAAATAADAPFASDGGGGAAPDISNMTPRERFDRLFNRIMRAAESGDANTVTTFAPMAIQAYSMLDQVDADARYHLALIQLHTGDVDGARAQGDSILKSQPGHLFGYVVKGTIARFQKDQKALDRSYTDFLSHYDAEQAAKRPEYAEHPRAIEEFLKAAREAKGGAS